jgi:hypothetical protein
MTEDPMTYEEETTYEDAYEETRESENTTAEDMEEADEDCGEDKAAGKEGPDDEMNTTYEDNETNDDDENSETNERDKAQELIIGHFSRRRNKKQKLKGTNTAGDENEQNYAPETVNVLHGTVEHSNVEGDTMTDEELRLTYKSLSCC